MLARVDLAYPRSRSIATDGSVSDGPVGTPASGSSIIKADSLDAAIEMAKGCSVLQGGAKISDTRRSR